MLLLNNDTEVISPDWMEAMLGQARRPQIGAVGAMLLYPDGTVQHGGVVLGILGLAGHAHRFLPGNARGYHGGLELDTNYLAVTGACLMVEKRKYEEVGGLDESLAVSYNDVDLCLKLRRAGYRNVFVPRARLHHYESKSRGGDDTPAKVARAMEEVGAIRRRWPALGRARSVLQPQPHRRRRRLRVAPMTETASEVLVEATTETGRSQVAAHAGVTFAGLMAANVLGYVFYTLVSRTLGVEVYGTFSSLVAVVLILAAPALIAQMVVAKLATDFAGSPDKLAGLVRAIDRATFTVAFGAGLLLVVASVPMAEFLKVSDPLLVALAGLSLCGAIALPFLRGVLQGTSAFGAFALSNVAEGLGKAVFAPLLGLLGGVRGAFAGLALGYAAATAYTFFAALPHRRGVPVPLSLRTVAKTSAAVALAVFCLNVLLLYDVVLAKRYLDAHTAGLYGAAALASRALFAVIAFVPTVLLPQAAVRFARGERTRTLFLQALGVAALICAAAVGFFALFPHFVITTIAGRSFSAGGALLLPYVYAVAMLSLANVTATYNIARGRMRFVIPLGCVALGEIVVVLFRHANAVELLQTIAVGHTLALLACAVSLGGRTPRAATSDPPG